MNPSSAIRLFIADDSKSLHSVLLTYIEQVPGVEVVGQAFTGYDAILGIGRMEPDVLLLDIGMPRGDGFSVLRAIGSARHQPLIIAMSFEHEPLIRNRCLELGAHMFLDKAEGSTGLIAFLRLLGSGELTTAEAKQPASLEIPNTTTDQLVS